jgi:hypothetical protein
MDCGRLQAGCLIFKAWTIGPSEVSVLPGWRFRRAARF